MESSHLESAARALESLDAERLVAQYAREFVFQDAAAGLEVTGRDELRRYYDALFSMPGVAFTEVSFFQNERGAGAGEWVWSGLGQGGEFFSVRGASIFELSPTGIVRETIYYRPPIS
jgi:hypothetical protein